MNSRVVVVTGSSSGIGKCIAEVFAKKGDSVLVHGFRNFSGLSETADRIAQAGSEVRSIVSDIADSNSNRKLVDAAFAWRNRVDVWINAAGADVLTGAASQMSFDEKFSKLWKTDVLGTIQISRAVASRMLEQESIVQDSTFLRFPQLSIFHGTKRNRAWKVMLGSSSAPPKLP